MEINSADNPPAGSLTWRFFKKKSLNAQHKCTYASIRLLNVDVKVNMRPFHSTYHDYTWQITNALNVNVIVTIVNWRLKHYLSANRVDGMSYEKVYGLHILPRFGSKSSNDLLLFSIQPDILPHAVLLTYRQNIRI